MMILYINGIILGIYLCMMLALLIGWLRLKSKDHIELSADVSVSIIIPARNEASNLPGLLHDISQQTYPLEYLEVIVIDDHSEDDTSKVVNDFRERPVSLIQLSATGTKGKKSAIEEGVRSAKGELIVATDADCRAGSEWVSSIVAFYKQRKPELILSPVRLHNGRGILDLFQEMEFMSLQFSTAGSAALGFPILANGANLAYKRESFIKVGGYNRNMSVPSGDDVFLLQEFKRVFGPGKIHYHRQPEASIQTGMESTWKGFIAQRLRWVSKTRGIHDPVTLAISSLIFLTNFMLVLLLIASFFVPYMVFFFLIFYIVKLFIDFIPFLLITHFFKRKSILWTLPLLEILNGFYTVSIGILGNIRSYSWKGRVFKKS